LLLLRALVVTVSIATASVVVALLVNAQTVNAQPVVAQTVLNASMGQALFEKRWVTPPSSTSASDGLGPYYDARSCVACHPKAGQGAYPDSLTAVLTNDAMYGQQLQRYAVPAIKPEAQLTITDLPAMLTDVNANTFAQSQKIRLSVPQLVITALRDGDLHSPWSLRLPPPLAGVAQFADVSDIALQALADPDDRNGDGISGRLRGRYGWKAEIPTLAHQIGKALSVDLGLGNSTFPTAHGDCSEQQVACVSLAANTRTGTDLEADAVVAELLASYLHALPVHSSNNSENDGERLFTQFQCAACHQPTLPLAAGQSLQAWTDLLVHDLGPALAVGTNGTLPTTLSPLDDSPLSVTAIATASEWRTAPLWGLAQRTRFLHDGRAGSIAEAIIWHDGEAASARSAYIKASKEQREHLLRFLRGL
jgi:CxxC motif-containing protein (DUF1111 family)